MDVSPKRFGSRTENIDPDPKPCLKNPMRLELPYHLGCSYLCIINISDNEVVKVGLSSMPQSGGATNNPVRPGGGEPLITL